MASESTQVYPLFPWPCGKPEVNGFLHHAVYCPPRLSRSRYNVGTPFCENASVSPLLLGPTHLSERFALSQGLHWSPLVQGLSFLGVHLYTQNQNFSSNCGSYTTPPWAVCPCVVGQGSLALILEAFFPIFVQVMRTLSSLHSFTFWIPKLGREPPPHRLVLLSSLNNCAKWPSLYMCERREDQGKEISEGKKPFLNTYHTALFRAVIFTSWINVSAPSVEELVACPQRNSLLSIGFWKTL